MLVWSDKRECYLNGLPRQDFSGTVAMKNSIFEDDNSLTLVRSELESGLNKASRKRYYRWKKTNLKKVYFNQQGKLAMKGMYRPGSGKPVWSGALDPTHFQGNSEWATRLSNKFGPQDFHSIYPLAAHYGVNNFYEIPTGMAPYLKQDDLRGLIDLAFGKTRYRRDMARAVGGGNLAAIATARNFRGLVPIDWMVKFMEDTAGELPGHMLGGPGRGFDIRKLVLNTDDRSFRRLLREPMRDAQDLGNLFMNITDLARISPGTERPVGRVNSWIDYHDSLYVRPIRVPRDFQRRVIVRQPYTPPPPPENEVIKFEDIHKTLDGINIDGYRIVMAPDTDTIRGWGEKMRNCIGIYARDAVSNRVQLGAVYRDDKCVINFEINNKRLIQFLGACNQSYDSQVVSMFETFFSNNGIDISSYLGKPLSSRLLLAATEEVVDEPERIW